MFPFYNRTTESISSPVLFYLQIHMLI